MARSARDRAGRSPAARRGRAGTWTSPGTSRCGAASRDRYRAAPPRLAAGPRATPRADPGSRRPLPARATGRSPAAPAPPTGRPASRRTGRQGRGRGLRPATPPCAGRPRAAPLSRRPTGRRRLACRRAADRGPCLAGPLANDVGGTLVVAQPRKRGCRRRSSRVHSAKPIWATSSGLVQWVPRGIGRTSTNGDSGVSSSRSRSPSSRSAAAV
jgi:hypothetical protein